MLNIICAFSSKNNLAKVRIKLKQAGSTLILLKVALYQISLLAQHHWCFSKLKRGCSSPNQVETSLLNITGAVPSWNEAAIFLLLKLLLTSNFTVRHRHRQRQIYDDNQSRMWTMLSLRNSGSGSVNLTLVGISYSDFFFGKIMSRKSVWSWAWMNFTQKLIKVLNYNKMINSREWNHFSTRILPGVFGQTSTCQSFFVSTSPYQRACCGNWC